MDVVNSVVDVRDNFYGAFERTVLGPHALGGRWTECQ
jgi:hypothetical protein